MKKKIKIIIIGIVVLLLIFLIYKTTSSPDNFHAKYDGYDLETDIGKVSRANTYKSYLKKYANKTAASENIKVDIFNDISSKSTDVEIRHNYAGEDTVLYTGDGSSVTWNVEVPEEGLYNIELDYIAVPSRGVEMERTVKINGELPFTGASTLDFSRLWTDGSEITKDNQGNEIRPSQKEIFDWQEQDCKDSLGYEVLPYKFYFHSGENTLSLIANNEPMILRGITLKKIDKEPTYKDYIASFQNKPEKVSDVKIKVQGEAASVRSDQSLFEKYDRASPTTEPYDIRHTVLNYIGGDSWRDSGQWIQWNITVPKDGFYNISIKGRQNYQRGNISCRSVYIDGKIPFAEVESIGFNYKNDWQLLTMGDEDGNPYQFYLTKGTHTIRLEATLGNVGSIINDLQDSVYRLNSIYRTILVLTGARPDQYRDYNIEKVYPDELKAMMLESRRLYKMVDNFVTYSGEKSDKIAPAQTLAVQLERFYNKPYKITETFSNFKDNITNLGGSLLTLSETKLDIDYLVVTSPDRKLSDVSATFGQKFKHETKSFFASFLGNYGELGNVYDKNEKGIVSVWIQTGRDQSTVLKNMIDDTFGPKTGIHVNLKLIDANALLNAVIAGNGPNVILSLGNQQTGTPQPVDYALRNAAEDLTQFDDFDEVKNWFYDSAFTSYKYNGGVYALPETQVFNLLFYRTDILAQLGLSVPQTWDDLISMFSTLQGNNLSVGIPYPSVQTPTLSLFYSMIYQRGGKIYNDDGTRTLLDSEPGIKAFKTYTNFFNSYGCPTVYDSFSRFRSGEMPVLITDYTTYNTLMVSAPEIKGLWDFALLPGVEKTDAAGHKYIDRTTNSFGVCCMMIKTDDELVRQNAWKFMKWWVSADTQVRFGREMESILGASARYATANVDALKQLAWSSSQLKVLLASLHDTQGFCEVPGGYYTSRHVTNAIREIINEKEDQRETLIDYARKINEELIRKRQEFGLPVQELGVEENEN